MLLDTICSFFRTSGFPFNHIILRSISKGDSPDVFTAAMVFKNLCYNNKDNLSAGIIVAGWDKHNGGSVYNIPLGGSLHQQPFAIGGSGSTYIYGYCDSNYREGMTREECEIFVINCKLCSGLFFISKPCRLQ